MCVNSHICDGGVYTYSERMCASMCVYVCVLSVLCAELHTHKHGAEKIAAVPGNDDERRARTTEQHSHTQSDGKII